jgi:hypothetical protein
MYNDPVICAMVVPLALAYPSFTLYRQPCFRAHDVPRVPRGDCPVIDRHRPVYLNTIGKLNHIHRGYGGGVTAFAREVIARTGQYRCPVRHACRVHGAQER